jgi:protein tyrosine phosphatase (PTP) superfamily phosphohydrolase (DUF442 family)
MENLPDIDAAVHATPIGRRQVLLGLAAALACRAGAAQEPAFKAPNLVVVSPLLVTSGQPPAEALSRLGAEGFAGVVYLAPLTVPGAVRDEAAILAGQGVAFTHIPIEFNDPAQADFDALSAALAALKGRKVLVHCQVNMRASSMVFLHRVLVDKESPELAYEAVSKVWSPNGTWRRYIVSMLRKHGVAFEPY